jgi:hypothetical protein
MIEAVRYISLISWYRLKQRGNSRRNATAPVVSQFLESPVEVHGRKSGVPCTPARHIDKIERELGGPQVVHTPSLRYNVGAYLKKVTFLF